MNILPGWLQVTPTCVFDRGERGSSRVRRIVAFNTYVFADGIKRANLLARVVVGNIRLPGWGPIFARLESKPLLGGILKGGLHDHRQLPDHYLD